MLIAGKLITESSDYFARGRSLLIQPDQLELYLLNRWTQFHGRLTKHGWYLSLTIGCMIAYLCWCTSWMVGFGYCNGKRILFFTSKEKYPWGLLWLKSIGYSFHQLLIFVRCCSLLSTTVLRLLKCIVYFKFSYLLNCKTGENLAF